MNKKITVSSPKNMIKELKAIAKEKEDVRRKLEITAKKLAVVAKEKELINKKLGTLLDSIGDAVIAIDRSWNIILWNKSAVKLSGWTDKEVIGKPFRDFIKLIRESDRSENIRFIEDAMVMGKSRSLKDHSFIITKDNREVPVGDSAAPILNVDGEVIGAIIVMRDATDEREAALLRSDFAYASHQLCTPVTKALWSLEIALKSNDLEKTKSDVKTALYAIASVKKLSDELVSVSEIDQGSIALKIKTIKLADLFGNVLVEVGKKAEEIGVNINILPIPMSVNIDTDSRLLKKALVEIVENAIIYSHPKGEVKIDITINESEILIEVRDSGIGIALEHQPLIFTKFFRGSNYSTTEIAGAGLGLFIAKEYIKILKGKIWFKSEKDKGTTFYVSLPISNPNKRQK